METKRAIVLAAGRGSRMGESTSDRPKCFTELAGRRLIDWQLAALRTAGIGNVTIVTGYQAHMLNDGAYRTVHNARWADTNMVMSLYEARNLLERNTCIVSYSDIVYHPSIVFTLMETPGELVVAYDRLWRSLWSMRFDNPLDDAESFRTDAGRLRHIGQRASTAGEIEGQYMGLLKIGALAWSSIAAYVEGLPRELADRMDMTALLSRLIDRDADIVTVATEGRWCEVDSQEDANRYEACLEMSARDEAGCWSHDWRW